MILDSQIGYIIKENPEIFKEHFDAEYLILIVFLLYEMLKEEKSFWAPYFAIVNVSDLPYTWSEDELNEL